MSKVLIFGAGLRTRDTILPALSQLTTNFDADFVTLSGNQLAMKNKKTNCFKFGFSEIDYSKYDLEQDGGRHIAIPTGWVKSIAYLDITYRENENGHG